MWVTMYRWGTGWSSCTPTPSPDFSVMKTTWMTAVPSSQGNSTVHRLVTEPHQVKWTINIWTFIWYRSFRYMYITVFVSFHNLKISNNYTMLIKFFSSNLYCSNKPIRYTVYIQCVHVICELWYNNFIIRVSDTILIKFKIRVLFYYNVQVKCTTNSCRACNM